MKKYTRNIPNIFQDDKNIHEYTQEKISLQYKTQGSSMKTYRNAYSKKKGYSSNLRVGMDIGSDSKENIGHQRK